MKVTYKVERKKLCEIRKGELFLDGSGDLNMKTDSIVNSNYKLYCAVNLITSKAASFDSLDESFCVVNAEMTVEEFV